MILSGFYRPRWSDIYKGATVLVVVAAFAFLLADTPILYYLLLAAVSIGGMAIVISITIGIRALFEKRKQKM